MNPEDRAELERLKQQHAALQQQVHYFAASLDRLSESLTASAETLAPLEIPPMEVSPLPLEAEPAVTLPPLPVPPPIPPVLSQGPPPLPPLVAQAPAASIAPGQVMKPGTPAFAEAESAAEAAATEKPETSFEVRLGTYWLVRIGVVVLLTGLVFLGNYAYENFAGKFGPPGKLAMLYLASGLLIGVGSWLQRPAQKKSLKQYGQVVFAGGLAAAYFTTYAAHHVPQLRVIENPVVDGILLLLFAGLIFWMADRRKSQVLALFAVGLAYYTSIITNIGLFTLYSNLVLSVTAVLFLVRNRWATISFASLVGTYVGFAFWWFHGSSQWPWDEMNAQFWNGILFLSGYWLVFTSAIFLSRVEQASGTSRAVFLTVNNAWYFVLAVFSMLQNHREQFWKFAIGLGAVLLVCAALAQKRFGRQSGVFTAYLAQGLVIFTIGIIAHFSGLQLALLLAGQSVVLFVLSGRLGILTMKIGAFATALLATGAAVWLQLRSGSPFAISIVGALLFFNAIWANRRETGTSLFRPVTTFFSVLALIVWFAVTNTSASEMWRPPLLAGAALLLTWSIYLLRCREVALLGQAYIIVAQILCLLAFMEQRALPWWNAGSVIAASLFLSHWWKRQKRPELQDRALRNGFEAAYAFATIGVAFLLLKPQFAAEAWTVTACCAVGILVYAIATRSWYLAAASQLFLLVSVYEFLLQLAVGKPVWYLAAVPVATLLLVSFSVAAWLRQRLVDKPDVRTPILQAASVYRWVAIALSFCWIFEYVPAEHYFVTFTFVGAALFVLFGWKKNEEGLIAASTYLVVGQIVFFGQAVGGAKYAQISNVIALLALPVLQQIAKRRSGFYQVPAPLHAAMMVIGALGLWVYVSHSVIENSGGFYFFLTATWALFAFGIFALGWLVQERVYRWFGLVVLGCALSRVFLVDVWRLDTVYRILSFMALGVVLLVLGFFYNKYQTRT